jgi:DnaJ-class molecular chaperone
MQEPNYAKLTYKWQQHHNRYRRFIQEHGYTCQDCGGAGGETIVISYELGGPWEECGWCEGTGRVTRWTRGIWLRWKKEEKKHAV